MGRNECVPPLKRVPGTHLVGELVPGIESHTVLDGKTRIPTHFPPTELTSYRAIWYPHQVFPRRSELEASPRCSVG